MPKFKVTVNVPIVQVGDIILEAESVEALKELLEDKAAWVYNIDWFHFHEGELELEGFEEIDDL